MNKQNELKNVVCFRFCKIQDQERQLKNSGLETRSLYSIQAVFTKG